MSKLNAYLAGFVIATLASTIAFLVGRRLGFFTYHGRKGVMTARALGQSSPLGLLSALGAFAILLFLPALLGKVGFRLGISAASPLSLLVLTLSLLGALLVVAGASGKRVWKWLWNGPLEVERPLWRRTASGAAGLVVAYPMAEALMTGISALLSWRGFSLQPQLPIDWLTSFREQPASLLSALVALVVITPILEELLFRGFLQSALRRYLNRAVALIITAALFAAAHYGARQGIANLPILAGIFVLGIFLGYLFERERTLLAPISLHILFNAVGTGLTLITAEVSHANP
jgi:uncharacterized protein